MLWRLPSEVRVAIATLRDYSRCHRAGQIGAERHEAPPVASTGPALSPGSESSRSPSELAPTDVSTACEAQGGNSIRRESATYVVRFGAEQGQFPIERNDIKRIDRLKVVESPAAAFVLPNRGEGVVQ